MARPKDTTLYTEKTCIDCGATKPLDELVKGKKNTMGRRALCMACERKRQMKRYHANPQPYKDRNKKQSKMKQRFWKLRKAFGLSLEQYDEILKQQGGVCAICKSPPNGKPGRRWLHVDHCHVTGTTRGLLCMSCNNGLGRFKDDPNVLRRAAGYVEHHQHIEILTQTWP